MSEESHKRENFINNANFRGLEFAPRSLSFVHVASQQCPQSVVLTNSRQTCLQLKTQIAFFHLCFQASALPSLVACYPDSFYSVRPQIRFAQDDETKHVIVSESETIQPIANQKQLQEIKYTPTSKSKISVLPQGVAMRSNSLAPCGRGQGEGLKTAFTEPSRGMSGAKVEQTSAETLSFRCVCERCRLMRGEVGNENRKVAFTLAEVLITLGIIGVVAAVTIPSIIDKYNEIQTVTKLKKAYSTLVQSYNLYMEETGDVFRYEDPTQSTVDTPEYTLLFNIIKKQYKKIKECHTPNDGCFAKGYYKTLTGEDYTYGYGINAGKAKNALITPDGITFGFGWDGRYQQSIILVDINGPATPNRGGFDEFAFVINNDKILPLSSNLCNPAVKYNNTTISNRNMNGWGCTKWVLTNENLDYQKCVKGIQKYCNNKYN